MAVAEAPRREPSGPPPTSDNLASSLLKTKQELEVDKIFRASVKIEASDLHMKVGSHQLSVSKVT